MRTHILMAALLAASALAACGNDPAEPAANREREMRDAQLEFAKCMREHGVDMPDPKPGARGIQLTEPKNTSPLKMRDADRACHKYLDKIKPPELSDEQQKKFQEAALAHARCMREHGIDFPDPTFGENGQATIRLGKGKSGLDPLDPKFKDAEKACQSKLPDLRDGGDGPATTESSP
jgi:hypothetical protein